MDFKNIGVEKITLIIILVLIVLVAGYFISKDLLKKDLDVVETPNSEIINTQTSMTQKQGVQIEILKEGADDIAKNNDMVQVHYTGTLENGIKFDSSLDRNMPFSFKLGIGQVIKGWDIGVEGMKIGEKRKLTIPSDLAYGDIGVPQASIPPKATLIFEVELLSLN